MWMSNLNSALIEAVRSQIESAQRILLVSHARPDGDAIGSLLGFGLSLQAARKQVQMVSPDGVPVNLRHLEGSRQVVNSVQGRFDLVVVLDCSDLQRVGGVLDDFSAPDVNIDHHVTNLNFARYNLVDTQAVATAQILVELIPVLDLLLPQTAAAALLTGMLTDTIGFRTANMTSAALRLAADLMDAGAKLPELYYQALVSRTFDAARLWGIGLSKLERDSRIIWTSLTLADRASIGYTGGDSADLTNVISAIDGADIALIFMEQPDGRVKVSWRAQPGIDTSGIALRFGGGGHPSASGADIQGSLEEVQASVLRATHALLNTKSVTS